MNRMQRRGFTLVELLAVLLILAVLVTLSSKGVRSVRLQSKKTQARVEMGSIEVAVHSYVNKYGKLPVEDALQGGADPEADESFSRTVILALTGMNTQLNPSEMVFLESQGNAVDGSFKDPWGEQYRIALDAEYNGSVALEGQEVRRKVAVASVGLYVMNHSANTNDLIFSWM